MDRSKTNITWWSRRLVDTQVGSLPGMTTLPHLHEFSVTGPMKVEGVSDTPSRRKIFACRPAAGADEIPCAKQIIAALARQAYRRPVTDNDLEALLSFYQSGRNEGDFETGIRTAIQAMLANPEFVFRFERVPAGVAPGRNYPHQRSGTGLAPLVFLVEQRARRATDRARQPRTSCTIPWCSKSRSGACWPIRARKR